MDDDIVKRLRSEMHYRPDSAVIAAAADLIEAQQAEIERLRVENNEQNNDITRLLAEVVRLRAVRNAEHALADQLAGELRVATEYADWPEPDHLRQARSVLAAYEEARRG